MMFRSISAVYNLTLRRSGFFNHYRYLTNLNSSKPIQDATQTDNNEWLWEYLRHRQSFQALNDEQKRQIISLE
jgi:hypothetical protein